MQQGGRKKGQVVREKNIVNKQRKIVHKRGEMKNDVEI